jgi:cytochrome P450 family 138
MTHLRALDMRLFADAPDRLGRHPGVGAGRVANVTLPPGPRMPPAVQTLAMLTRQRPYLERCRRRYGDVFSLRILGLHRLVVVSDPALIKSTFRADAATLHAGSRSPLRPVLGDHSLLAIDEDRHLQQRRLLLPAFKGQRMAAYESVIESIAADEIARWPQGRAFATAPSMQRITLRAILRAVFGASGSELRELEALLPAWTTLGSRLSQFPWLQRDLGARSPWGRLLGLRGAIDAVLDRLIRAAREDDDLGGRADVLAALVQAEDADGRAMADDEIRDQLVTMLAAGHETTAHTLAWAIERLSRHPDVLAALVDEADAGGRALRDATIREVQRMRPVIAFAGRYTVQPFQLGPWALPPGVMIGLCAALTHYDARLFASPQRFAPERFLHVTPDTYAWIPFGGGVRRCIGASFAHLELDVVLRVLLQRVELLPTSAASEPWRFRGVAWTPASGGQAVVRRRAPRAAALAA